VQIPPYQIPRVGSVPYDPAPATEAELLDDLLRLLADGLVLIDSDDRDAWDGDEDAVPRFYLTARGRALSSNDRLFRSQATNAVDPVPSESPKGARA